MKIVTKGRGSEFEKFDSVMKALIAVPKQEIAERPKAKRRKNKGKKN